MSEKPVRTHGTCPYCSGNECFSLWADGSFKCHQCGATPKTKGVTTSTSSPPAPKNEDLKGVFKSFRGLSDKTVKFFGIKTLQDKDGKDVKRVYPYPHGPKYRTLPKDFRDNKGFTNDHLFGMDKFNGGSSKHITIVEGEEDVPAAWEMLGGKAPVVGIPGGSISDKLLKNCYEYLNSFESIIVATDNDDTGRSAMERLAAVFPSKTHKVSLTLHNDPMEYFEEGDKAAFKFAWINKTKFVPEYDTSTPEAFLKILDEDEDDNFIPSGIEAYDEKHLGLFQGHVTMFQAPEGTGKTELFHMFEYHMAKNFPEIPFASCHLEETKKRTMLSWASYDLDKNVTRKDLITDMDEVKDSLREITKYENAHLFSIGTDEDPMVLLDRIKYYATVFGCKYIFIEPIQDLAQQYTGTESTERFLSKIAVNLARIASEYKIGILMIAHENDEGLVSDCRKLSKQASVVVRLERNIESSNEEERNTTTLRSKKNRPTAFVGYGGQLTFDENTFKLKEKF